MSKFKPFTPGDNIALRAPTLNAWQAAAEAFAKSRLGGNGNIPGGGRITEPDHVWVEASDFTLLGAVLTPTGYAANDPKTYELEASHQPVFTASPPTSDDDAIIIIDRPETHSGTGDDPPLARAVLSGRATVKVLISDATHRYARPEAGNSEYLVSDDYGPAFLLVPPAGTGVGGTDAEPRFEVVLLGMPQPLIQVRSKTSLGLPCLIPIKDTAGDIIGVAGIAQRIIDEDGVVRCETSGYCVGDDCGETSVDPGPPEHPPYVPPVPPPPLTYDIFVTISECPGFTPSGFPYTVRVNGANIDSVLVGPDGAWFTGIPYSMGTNVILIITGTPVVWATVASVGCGGATYTYGGTVVPVMGGYCANMSVAFTVGLPAGGPGGPVGQADACVPAPPITSIGGITVPKPAPVVGK